MTPVVVMVAFYSTTSTTERLATAVALGAVQKRAAIRMRRMPDPDPPGTIRRFPRFKADLERMNRHYVPPTEDHVLEADVLVFGVPSDFTAPSSEWQDYLQLLARMAERGQLNGKIGVAMGSRPGLAAFSETIAPLGLIAGGAGASRAEEIPPAGVEAAIRLGRHVVDLARELKESSP